MVVDVEWKTFVFMSMFSLCELLFLLHKISGTYFFLHTVQFDFLIKTTHNFDYIVGGRARK